MASYQSFSKETRFRDLCESIKYCSLCPRLQNRNKVLSEANGNLWSKVLFIAEAPGRLGADRTGIPLFGDKTGEIFSALLGNIGWKREDIFITNALLCNPRNENGTNGTPKSKEIANCAPYLEMVIELVQPEVIVTLGIIALKALTNIAPHNFSLNEHVGKSLTWWNRVLIPLYHPGPRARVHRSYPNQTADFIALAKFVDPIKGIKHGALQKVVGAESTVLYESPTAFHKLILAIVRSLGKMTYFKLTKLLYLTDLKALQQMGSTLSGEIYVRQQEGPWPPKLKKAIPDLEGREVLLSFRKKIPFIEPGPSPRVEVDFNNKVLEILGEVLDRYGNLDNASIKRVVYRTPPMRYILEQEKLGRDMRKIPLIYKNLTAPEHDSTPKNA
jgi:uracil-DNA glycosylase family 4